MNIPNEILLEMLTATKPSKEAIDEARARRDLVKTAAMTYEGALSFIKSGSLAHHTLICTVSDADGSLVLDRRTYGDYGPDSEEKTGPEDLVLGIAENIRDTVRQVYPDVYISTNHKRAIYFRFRAPLKDGQDPTVDLVIGLNRKDQPGIWIPNLDDNDWDASDPAKHTDMVRALRQSTGHTSSKVIRAAKLFSKQWSNELLTSFHWTALTLESYHTRKPIINGLIDVLNHTAESLENGDTDDPAGVSGPIYPPSYRNRSVVISRTRNAAAQLEKAREVEGDDEAALDEIVDLFSAVFRQGTAAAALEQAVLTVRRKILDQAIENSNKSPLITHSFSNRPVLNTRAFASAQLASPTSNRPITSEDTSEPNLSRFEGGLHNTSYRLLWRNIDKYKITYTITVPLLDKTGSQFLTVEVLSKSVRVMAHGLSDLRHVNSDGSLCLWFPGDDSSRRWTHDKGLVSLLDLIVLHLYKEARFKETGTWLGDEVHND